MTPDSRASRQRIWLVLLVLAAIYFAVRGPWRALFDSGDFLTLISAARCWLHGMNPYAPTDLLAAGHAAGAPVSEEQFRIVPSVYLPMAYPVLAPFALLPWPVAKIAWLCCLLALTLAAGRLVVRMTKAPAAAIWAALLAFAPLQTGISKGQPSVAVCALIVFSLAFENPYAAGAMLGVALCLKPQLALGFLLLAGGVRQWSKALAALGTAAVLGIIGMVHLHRMAVQTLHANLAAVSAPAGLNSGSPANPFRFQLITIDTLIPGALHSTPVILVVSLLIAAISGFAALRSRGARLAIAVVAGATILLGYHRFYDAQVLWLGIPAIPLLARRWSLALLALYSVFLIPGQTLLARWMHQAGELGPMTLALMYHEVLACIAIWLIFLGAALSRRETPPI